MSVKKILIADDHVMTRKGIELLLKYSFPEATIIEASDGKEVIAHYKSYQPDVLLIDYNMPEMNGYDVAHLLLGENINIKIILHTMFDTKPIALNFFKIGGKGFVCKGGNSDHICNAIRLVAIGEYYISSFYEKEILEWLKIGVSQKVSKIKFTPLELAIVIKMAKGKTSKEIGEELKISDRTVETYRYDLIKKTEVKKIRKHFITLC